MPLPKTYTSSDGNVRPYKPDDFDRDDSRPETYIHKPTGVPFKLSKEDRKALQLTDTGETT